MKAETSRLIPLEPIENVELFIVKLNTYLFYQRIQVRHVKQNSDPVWQQAQNKHENSYR